MQYTARKVGAFDCVGAKTRRQALQIRKYQIVQDKHLVLIIWFSEDVKIIINYFWHHKRLNPFNSTGLYSGIYHLGKSRSDDF